ncbi:hypothetical protein ACVJGD_008419 [Bradyrhizobium sp. USDA 10063]
MQRFRGNRRLRRDVNIPELPPRMREAECQLHQTAAVLDQTLVGGIAVDLQDALVVSEQLFGADRLAILGKYADHRRRCRAVPRAVIGGEHLFLPIQRQLVAVFHHRDVGQ